jgi:hypothetical protein
VLWGFRSTNLALIEDEDLENFLREIGRWDDLHNGTLRCAKCDKILNLDILSAIVRVDGDYEFLCDSEMCLAGARRV